jgi:YHS domain-containing protein
MEDAANGLDNLTGRQPMARVTDPVCGMTIDSETAEARAKDAAGRTVYFCSVECQRQFEAHPELYDERAAETATTTEPGERLERHDSQFTKSGDIVSPKFGSAGSGGAEYERLPEQHDDRP